MARAILIAGLLASPAALAQGGFENRPGIPEQMVGLQGRLGASALAGEGAGDVDQPPLSHLSGSLQIRVIPDWYAELSTFGERTLRAEAPAGKTILGIEGTTLGVRRRGGIGATAKNLLVLGAGGGAGRVFVQGKGIANEVSGSHGGGMAYVLGGFEKELYGDHFNAGYVGVEAMWQQYFVGEKSPFRGGGATVRVTFSYYMGGPYCAECW